MTTITPHGGTLVNRIATGAARDHWLGRAAQLPKITLDAWQLSDVEIIAIGAVSPLQGFLGQRDYQAVVSSMRLTSGLPWSIPVTLSVSPAVAKSVNKGHDAALVDGSGTLVAVLHVEEVYAVDKAQEAQAVFKTTETKHPGVARLMEAGEVNLAGQITVINRPKNATFQQYLLDPIDTRAKFNQLGWTRVVGFQTRNPIHRAHEYIQKTALEIVDGLLLHPIVGETKSDDVSAAVRMRCYEALLANYYPKDRVILAVNPASMRYAGPREAIFHALIRKNYGCTHFIVGRDHAGVGSYYGTFDAQRIFDEFKPEELGITPLMFDNTFYCKHCQGMASIKTCPHGEQERVSLSGTKLRGLLQAGQLPPPEVSRPEVAQVLIESMAANPAVRGTPAAA